MNDSLRRQFETTSGLPGELLAELIAAACVVLITAWICWVAMASLGQLRDRTAGVSDVISRVLWSGVLFCLTIAVIAFVE